ncbi:MAG: endolytic transglycosylase MltG, partial [Armatimonadetes bacterium]|nr:endolytic transglycosylase MltG [Armatimonadota bacterium]
LNFAKNNSYKINGYIISNLEGYLFPDSYYFPKNSKANIIIETMLKRFKDQILPIYNQNKPKLKYSLKQIIILASLVEMEAYLIEEQPLIASVYYNRLKLNMLLQCDATIQYSLPKFKPYLTYNDLKINSPYNTYQNLGFPPGAIANPGKRAVLASFFPAKTNYLYYVRNDLKGDGSHIFSNNYAEHLAAIKKYQR